MKTMMLALMITMSSLTAFAQTSATGLPKLTDEKGKQLQCAIARVNEFLVIPATTVGFGSCKQIESLAGLVSKGMPGSQMPSCGLSEAEAEQVVKGVYKAYFGERALQNCATAPLR